MKKDIMNFTLSKFLSMRQILIIILTIITNLNSFTQNLKDSLIGKWICIQSFDSTNKPMLDYPTSFYSFEFSKNTLNISSAPFNSSQPPSVITVNNKKIQLYPDYGGTFDINTGKIDMTRFPEGNSKPIMEFEIQKISNDSLTLTCQSFFNGKNKYVFIKKSKCTIPQEYDSLYTVENKYILLRDLSPLTKKAEYWFNRNFNNTLCQPVFKGDFGNYMINRIKLPKSFPLDSISSEIIVQFTVNELGTPESIEILQGLNKDINNSIIKAIIKTKKKWKPVIIDDKYIRVVTRYYFFLYKNEGSLF